MEASHNGKSVLIVARPSRFRDGLQAIVRSWSWIGLVEATADWTAVPEFVMYRQTDLIIFDIEYVASLTWPESGMVRGGCEKVKCMAIIDRADQREIAEMMMVDWILMRGFSTEQLCQTVKNLVYDNSPNESTLSAYNSLTS